MGVGFDNFKRIFNDPLVRDPFLSVFLWTFVYAGVSVLLTFALGLFLAVTLNKSAFACGTQQPGHPLRDPAFLAVLVWGGQCSTTTSASSTTSHPRPASLLRWCPGVLHPRQLLARLPVLLPHLHGCPAGDSRRAQRGRARRRCERAAGLPQGDLPAPARGGGAAPDRSFAFNFNNFNNIYFLTRGGPYGEDQVVAGSTDILISYTYKLAFQAAGRRGLRPRGGRLDHHLLHHRGHLRDLVLAHEGAGEPRMSTGDVAPTPARSGNGRGHDPGPRADCRRALRLRGRPSATLRYVHGLAAHDRFAVFPAIYIVSTAFNPNPTLSASTILPDGFTLDNFRYILSGKQEPYLKWYATTMTVAGVTAVLTVLLGALGAYAFSASASGTADGDADAPARPDVPALPRLRRDLPDHAAGLRRVPATSG